MFDFFSKIFEYINVAFNMVLSIIVGIFQFLKTIPQILGFTTTMASFIPSFLTVFFLVGITFAVVLKIIGRK